MTTSLHSQLRPFALVHPIAFHLSLPPIAACLKLANHSLVGLERTFRLFQSVTLVLYSYTWVFELLVQVLKISTVNPPSPAAIKSILLALRKRLGLARRFFRVFRFFGAFNSAHKLYLTISPSRSSDAPRKPSWVQTEAWLDVFARTFNGMYLLLETSTMVDALQIEGLRIWTPEWDGIITVEAQRFWLFALVCGLFGGILKMVKVLAYTPVPPTGDGFAHGKAEGKGATATTTTNENEKAEERGEEEFDVKKEQERLRGIMKKRKKGRSLWIREIRRKLHGLGRGVVANALDTVIPGVVVGWIDVSPGTVGLAMFVTTILTSMDAWERCGQEIAQKD
jgi:hypothetical protein